MGAKALSDCGVVVLGGTAGVGFETAARFAEEGARVAIVGRHLERGAIACEKLRGCMFAPFNWRLAAAELVAILDDARPPIVFAGAEIADTMRKVRERTETKFEIVEVAPSTAPDGGLATWIKGSPTTDPAVKIGGDDIALLSYTSGTTGLPKGVTARHEALQYSFLCGTWSRRLPGLTTTFC
jgi:acyl-CoA synthetase (AMP-forming)/AMP-acid ligase II